MVAPLNGPMNTNAMDDDQNYKQMLMAQLNQPQQPMDDSFSNNQFLATLNTAANQLGTINGRTAQTPEVQRFADVLDKSKNMRDQANAQRLAKQQNILLELAKLRDQNSQKQNALAMGMSQKADERAYDEQKQKRLFDQQMALEKLKEQNAIKLSEMKGENKKPPNEAQTNASMFAVRAKDASNLVQQIEKSGYNPGEYSASFRTIDYPLVGQVMANDADRSYDQAKRDFVTAVLRKESGAAIGKDEYANEVKKYFPEPGDGPQQLAQKAASRERAISGLINAAGPAYSEGLQHPFEYRPKAEQGSAYAATPKGPKAGDVEDGYRFKGGDPKDPRSWEEVK